MGVSIFAYICSWFSIYFAFLVVWNRNPFLSSVYLIIVFMSSVLHLYWLGGGKEGLDFLAFLILIVYIGAIAVLFLFVIYMLNIKLLEMNETN